MPSPDDQPAPAALEYESKFRRNPWDVRWFRILIAFLLWLGAAVVGGWIGALL